VPLTLNKGSPPHNGRKAKGKSVTHYAVIRFTEVDAFILDWN
jgi:hypothetical protein